MKNLFHWCVSLFVLTSLWYFVGYSPTPVYSADDCGTIVCNKNEQDENTYLRCVDDKKSCLQKKLEEINGEKITLTNTISLINGKISLQELQINQLEGEISQLEKEILELGNRITGLNVSLDRLSTVLIDRIKAQYKQSQLSPIVLIASSQSFNHLVSQYKYVTQAGQQTALAMGKAETQRIEYDEQKALKEEKQVEVQTKQSKLQTERGALSKQKQEQQFLLTETRNNEAKYQAELEKTLAELNAIQSIIAGKGNESKVSDVKQGDKIASIIVGASTCSNGTHLHFEVVKSGINYNPAGYLKSISAQWNNSPDGAFGFGGDWEWPLNDPAKINQGYGMTYYARVRRAYGGAPHTGLDIASKSQDYTVKAVKDGTLYRGSIACGGGLLRYVKVEHKDGGLDTYYLHVNY
ncbi:hypothetical protein KBC79_04805 [Candidatus Woesebacteria bacterium]|nr:hypothetical protein [Candidatus Woesebacteria bacterium]